MRKGDIKYTTHIVLGINAALENAFKSFEEKAWREVFAEGEMRHKVLHGASSIIILGLIALSKCLSSSHTALGYSLYTDYVTGRKRQSLSCETFKRFQHNRFGRMRYLTALYLEQEVFISRSIRLLDRIHWWR